MAMDRFTLNVYILKQQKNKNNANQYRLERRLQNEAMMTDGKRCLKISHFRKHC